MYRATNCRNLTLPIFHFLPLHRGIVSQSTAAYLAVPTPLSSTSIAELRVMSHPHLADSINAHSISFYVAKCHNVSSSTPSVARAKKTKKQRKSRGNRHLRL